MSVDQSPTSVDVYSRGTNSLVTVDIESIKANEAAALLCSLGRHPQPSTLLNPILPKSIIRVAQGHVIYLFSSSTWDFFLFLLTSFSFLDLFCGVPSSCFLLVVQTGFLVILESFFEKKNWPILLRLSSSTPPHHMKPSLFVLFSRLVRRPTLLRYIS